MSLPPFQVLLDAHGSDVHRFLVSMVGAHDADDCYQETWLAALRAYPRLSDSNHLRGWLLTIAHRKAIDQLRLRRRAIPVAEVPDQPDSASSNPTPPGARDEELFERVRGLSDKQRTAVALRFVADLAYAELGQVMGTSEEAARRNVHEGLTKLRKEYRR